MQPSTLTLDLAATELEAAATAIANEFVRRQAQSAGVSGDWLRGAGPFDYATRVVHLCASAVRGEDAQFAALGDSTERGARVALDGRPVAEAVDWLRALERVVTAQFMAGPRLDLDVAREGIGRISGLFDTLCTQQLESYASAHDELSTWYSRVGTDLVSCLVSGAPVEASVVNSQARVLGIEPHQRFRAVAVRHERNPSAHEWAQVRRRLSSLLFRYDPQRHVLVRESHGLVLAVVPADREGPGLNAMLERLLSDDELSRSIYVSTGEPTDSLATSGRSCRQALSALEIAIYRGQLGRVTQCTQVILEVLLAHNHWVSHRIVSSRLEGLVEKPHLLETLRAYITCNLALQRTAEELRVHPNTVAYRLRQIATITGRDMRSIIDLTELMVALTALDVVEMRRDLDEGRVDLRAQLLADAPATHALT